MKQLILPILLAFAAGAFVPIQTGANTLLTKGLGNGLLSTLVVFIMASLATLAFLFAQRPELPSIQQAQSIPWYAWTAGGVLGSIYIFILIYTAPKLGMATVVGLVVLGQIVMAMAVDHFGWLGLAVHKVNWQRIAGGFLMIIGLLIIKKY
ncbi:MAG: DMT family transporter [Bacteroidota bacterium]